MPLHPHPTHRPDRLTRNECGRGDVSQPKGPRPSHVKPRAGASLRYGSVCSKCGEPRIGVERVALRKHGHPDWCGDCYGKLSRSIRNARVDARTKRKWNVASRYGLTVEQVEQMERDQNGQCAVCRDVLANYHIDHNHTTGKVRGLLCHACNMKLPIVENPSLLAAAISYLKRSDG